MEALQKRIKAVAAFCATGVTSLLALYNVNQNLTLKEVVMAVIAAIVSGVAVHQAPKNK